MNFTHKAGRSNQDSYRFTLRLIHLGKQGAGGKNLKSLVGIAGEVRVYSLYLHDLETCEQVFIHCVNCGRNGNNKIENSDLSLILKIFGS